MRDIFDGPLALRAFQDSDVKGPEDAGPTELAS
jgi:hypothetical protein